MLSPMAASPFWPSSSSACVAEPPIVVRSAVTVMPELVGLVPGTTVTASSVVSVAPAAAGVAVPDAVGLVGVPITVNVTGAVAIGRAGSLLAMHNVALYTPAVRPVGFMLTVTFWLPPDGTVPLVGVMLSHGAPQL
jgi:hypothetical protein